MKNSRKKAKIKTMDDSSDQLNGLSIICQGFNVLTSEYPSEINSASQGIALVDEKDPTNVYKETYLGTTYEIPTGVSFQSDTIIDSASTVTGEGESSYSSSLAATVGVSGTYGLFTGSVDASYGTDVSTASSYYYSTCIETGETYTLGFSQGDVDLDGSHPDLNFEVSSALQQAFADLEIDEDGSNAMDFFNVWGTHVISGIQMGGQTSYSMYGSTSKFSSSSDFAVSAEASYATISGSASFKGSENADTSNVQSQATVEILGGSETAISNLNAALGTDDASAAYTDWFNSIQGNEGWYGFTDAGGMFLVSELCTIEDTKEYLENVYNQLTGVDIVTTSTDVNDESTMDWSDSPGATSGDYEVYVADKSGGNNTRTWAANDNEVLVGVGFYVNNNHHLTKMMVIALDMENQEYNSYFFNNGESDTSWQAFAMAPKGSVITGFAVSQKDKSVSDLIMFTQEVQLIDQSGVYLNPTVNQFMALESDPQEIDFDNLPFGTVFASEAGGSSIQDFNRSATVNFPPKDGNTLVINGFSLHSSNSSEPHDGFDYATTNFTELVLKTNTVGTSNAVRADKKRLVRK